MNKIGYFLGNLELLAPWGAQGFVFDGPWGWGGVGGSTAPSPRGGGTPKGFVDPPWGFGHFFWPFSARGAENSSLPQQ